MYKRRIAMLVCSIAMTVMFSGCSTKTEVTVDQIDDAVEQQAKDVDLTVWGAETDQELLNQIVDDFVETHKDEANLNITVEVQNEEDSKNAILNNVRGAADVFTLIDDQLMSLVAGGVVDVIENQEVVANDNIESSVEVATMNDSIYAYPLTADNGYFLYYNSDYFEEKDVLTLDRILEVAEKANKKVVMDWSSGWYLSSFFLQTGLELGLKEDGITNYCTWNSAEGDIKGVDVAKAMVRIASQPSFLSLEQEEALNKIASGEVIAYVSGTWNSNAIQNAWGKAYAATKLPTYTCKGQQVQMGSYSGYKLVGVNSHSENRDWAEKLALWIANEENQILRYEMRGQGPSNKNAAKSEEILAAKAIQAVIQQSEYATVQRVGNNFWNAATKLGLELAKGTNSTKDLQELLDVTVEEITKSVGK